MSGITLPSANRIPDKLINAKIYYQGGVELIGVGDCEPPSIEYITESVSGLGIAGEVTTPVIGHLKELPFKIKWHAPNRQSMSLLTTTMHQLEVFGSIQYNDAAAGELDSEAIKIVLRGMPKKVAIGKFEAAKKMDPDLELECPYIKIWLGGDEVLEVDKYAFICRVNGVDLLEKVRQQLGGD